MPTTALATGYRVIMPGDGASRDQSIDWPREPGYDKLKALIEPLIGGGRLEHVSVLHDGKRRDMFVDDKGRMKGLPRNDRATAIYRTNWLTQHPEVDPETLPFIAGPAVLFMRRVWY